MDRFEIERRSNLSYKEFHDNYLMPGVPVILSDSLKDWPAKDTWTPEYFKEKFGDKLLPIEDDMVAMSDFIEEVMQSSKDNPAKYLRGLIIHKEFPELASDIYPDIIYQLPDRIRSSLLPFYSSPTPKGIPELLITGAGGRFRLHYDKFHLLGFVTQVYGEKEFTIFPPEQGEFLYPFPDPDRENWSQIIYLDDIDLDKFPLYKQATPTRFMLHQGETLFNPQGWWHTTLSLTPSIAMVISTVNAANWSQFTEDFIRIRHQGNTYKLLRNKIYYAIAGWYLNCREKLKL